MAKKRERDILKITNLATSDFIRIVTATGKSGLLPYNNLPMLLEKNIGAIGGAELDYNELHKICPSGLTTFIVVAAAKNTPGAGVLLHLQRLGKGDISAGSFFVAELFFSMNNKDIKFRTASSDGTLVYLTNWVKLG